MPILNTYRANRSIVSDIINSSSIYVTDCTAVCKR